jgi:hypothetical protein
MRRDYFTLDVTIEEGTKPRITVNFDGPAESFEDRLISLDAEQLDIAYRLLDDDSMETGESGVLAVTNRVTGDFILECNADAGTISRLVDAAKGNDGCYRFSVCGKGRELLAGDRSIFLVYSTEGDLLRQHSLIPSGVEM